jgi:hypothetical protein
MKSFSSFKCLRASALVRHRREIRGCDDDSGRQRVVGQALLVDLNCILGLRLCEAFGAFELAIEVIEGVVLQIDDDEVVDFLERFSAARDIRARRVRGPCRAAASAKHDSGETKTREG